MAETIDEAAIIAWVDGELDEARATRVAQAVAADPDLAGLADRHRRMKARFASAFGPIAEAPVAMPVPAPVPMPVISLAAARAEREAKAPRPPWRWWGAGGAIAASLMVGLLVGHGAGGPAGTALPGPIAQALDRQLSGDGGAVRIALSFRDHGGLYCRSFASQSLSGVACRSGSDWQLRYASPASPQRTDYRMAGDDTQEMRFIQSAMAGEPLDHDGELAARAQRWSR